MQNEIKPAEIKIVASYISPEDLQKNPELMENLKKLKAIHTMNFPAYNSVVNSENT